MAISVPQPGNPNFATKGPFDSDPQSGYIALFKRAYTDLIRLELQQTESILQDTCINEAMRGEVLSFDRYLKHADADLAARTRGQTYGDQGNADAIQYKVTNTERRLVNPTFVDYAELFDPRDQYALMRAVRPDGQFLKNVSALFNRKKDSVILDAIKAAVTVDASKFGASTTTKNFANTNATGVFLPVGTLSNGDAAGQGATNAEGEYLYDNVPASKLEASFAQDGGANSLEGSFFVNANTAAANTGYQGSTLTKQGPTKLGVNTLIQARKVLHRKNAIQPGDRVFCVLHPNQFYQLMEDADDTRLTSIDFNDGKPLVGGAPMNYMGFEFRVTTQVPVIAAGAGGTAGNLGGISVTNANPGVITQSAGSAALGTGHEVYFYTDSAMVYGQAEEVTVRMDEIPERGYALQLYHSLGLGGLRLDGDKILIKRCLD
jgi:hypothetical protein